MPAEARPEGRLKRIMAWFGVWVFVAVFFTLTGWVVAMLADAAMLRIHELGWGPTVALEQLERWTKGSLWPQAGWVAALVIVGGCGALSEIGGKKVSKLAGLCGSCLGAMMALMTCVMVVVAPFTPLGR